MEMDGLKKMDVSEETDSSEEMEVELLDMPISMIERKEPPTLLTLPRHIIIKILDYSVTNVKSIEDLSEVCQNFKYLFSLQYLYNRIKVLPEDKVETVIDICKQHSSAIKSVEMYDLKGKKMNCILREMRMLENLRSLTMISTSLKHVHVSDVIAVVESCPKLSVFKASEGIIHERNADWKSVFSVLAERQLVELTYDLSPAHGRHVTLVCRKSRESLKALNFTNNFRGLSVETIGECRNLESLRLEMEHIPDGYYLSTRGLYSLENLVCISLEINKIIVPDLTEFFARPSCVKLKTIELSLGVYDRKLVETFDTIANVCSNLQKFSFHTLRLPFVYNIGHFIPATSIINLLQKCKLLESVTIAPIRTKEIYTIDKAVFENYRHIVPFNLTSYILSKNIRNADRSIPFTTCLDSKEYHHVMKVISDSIRVRLNRFGVRHLKKQCYLEIFEFFCL